MTKKRFFLIIIVITSFLFCKEEIKESYINAAVLGKLKVVTKFENGKKHGIEKYYYPTGEFAGEIQYDNGLKQGQSVMMPRYHPETMRLNKVISWQFLMMPRPHPETNENHALNFSIYCRCLTA